MGMMKYIPSRGKSMVNREGGPMISAKDILTAVEEYFSMTLVELMDKTRKREVCYPRQIAMWLLAHYSALTLNSIAVIFQKKDHTTVINSLEAIDNWMKFDEGVKKQVDEIIIKFNKNGASG